MKTIVAGLIFIAACLFFYHQQHPFGRPPIPQGHDYTADGVFYLRTAHKVSTPTGPVQWKQGQQVFNDPHAKTTAPDGMTMVTDGSHSTAVLTNMLSQDIQEGQELQRAEHLAQRDIELAAEKEAKLAADKVAAANAMEKERLRAATEIERLRASQVQMPTPIPTPKFGHTSLDQPTRRASRQRSTP